MATPENCVTLTHPKTRWVGVTNRYIRETLSDRMAILTMIYKCNHLVHDPGQVEREGDFPVVKI